MVQLRLQPVKEATVPSDCFVSVRLGQTQKLSKLDGLRSYRFPHTGDVRYGKIEIFRRIGVASVDMYQSFGTSRELNINCFDHEFAELGLNVMVDAEEKEKKQVQAKLKEAENDKIAAKVKSAKDYLNKHGLEVQLSEAMQDILRERPENPAQFLAAQLLKSSSCKGCSGGESPANATPRSQQNDAFLALGNKETATTPTRKRPVTPSHEFSQPPRLASKPQPVPGAALGDQPDALTTQESAPVEATLEPATREQEDDDEHASLTFAKLPSVGSWRKPLTKKRAEAVKASAKNSAAMKTQEALALVKESPALIQEPPVAFQLKPSVGTWCSVLLPAEENDGIDECAEPEVALPGPPALPATTDLQLEALPARAHSVANEGFGMSASVGSWLAPAPLEEPEEEVYRKSVFTPQGKALDSQEHKFRPSVGSWLAHRVLDDEETEEAPLKEPARAVQKHRQCVMPNNMIMGSNFYSLGVRPGNMMFV